MTASARSVQAGNVRRGILCTALSAVVFGLVPVVAKLSYQCGSNAMTLTFYKNWMSVPVLLLLLWIRRIPIRIGRRELRGLLLVGTVFSTLTTYLLFSAYNYIGGGLATTLHFLYPISTVVLGWVIFHQRPAGYKILAILLATAGIALVSGSSGAVAATGIALAIASAVAYAGYLLGVEHTAIREMDPMLSMFYLCIISGAASALLAVAGLSPDPLLLLLPWRAALWTLLLAVMSSAVAYVLLFIGIRHIGAGDAALYSMLEPVSGVACSALILGERLRLTEWISCVLILGAVLLPILWERRRNRGDPEG